MKKLFLSIIILTATVSNTVSAGGTSVRASIPEARVPIPVDPVLFSKCTNGGHFSFFQIEQEGSATLKALKSSFSFEKKSKYYVFQYTASKDNVLCTDGKTCSCGVGIFVIIKVTGVNTKININTVYDVSAVAQLHLATVTLDFSSYGLPPGTQSLFRPTTLSNLDIKSIAYFDGLLESLNKLADNNTSPEPLPTFTIQTK